MMAVAVITTLATEDPMPTAVAAVGVVFMGVGARQRRASRRIDSKACRRSLPTVDNRYLTLTSGKSTVGWASVRKCHLKTLPAQSSSWKGPGWRGA